MLRVDDEPLASADAFPRGELLRETAWLASIVLIGFFLIVPTAQLLRTNNDTAPTIAGFLVVGFVLSGFALAQRAPFAWSVGGSTLLLLALIADAFFDFGVYRAFVSIINDGIGPGAIDAQKLVAIIFTVAMTMVGLWLALALTRADGRVPLGIVLSPVIGIVVAVLVPTGRILGVLPVIALFILSFAVGCLILRWLAGAREAYGPLGWVVSMGLGLGAVTVLWLALGSLRQLSPVPILLTSAGLLIIARTEILGSLTLARPVVRWFKHPVALRQNAAMMATGALLSVLAIFCLIAAMAPDLGYDSTVAHMGIAKVFARQGSTEPGLETTVYFWHIPTEVLYSGLMSIGAATETKLLHFGFGALAVLGTATLSAHLTGQKGAALLAATTMLIPSLVWFLTGVGYVDLAAVFYFLVCICALVRWVETENRRWLLAVGLLSGIALSSKATTIALVLILPATILIRQRHSPRAIPVSFLLCAGPALLAWSPWLIRSFLLSGNPVFPWFNNIFQSPLEEPLAVYAGVRFGIGTTVAALLSLPFSVTFEPERFVETGELGAHFLAAIPLVVLALLTAARDLRVAVVVGAAVCFTLIWAFGLLQNLRYLMPALTMFAVTVAVGYARISRWPSAVLVAPALVVALYLATIGNALNPRTWWMRGQSGQGLPYKVVLGLESEDDYLARYVAGYRAFKQLNETVGADGQLWAPNFTARLYSDVRVYFDDLWHVALPIRDELGSIANGRDDPEVTYEKLRELGFTHLLLSSSRKELSLPESERPTYLRQEFRSQFAALEYADNGNVLYRLDGDAGNVTSSEAERLENGGFEDSNDGNPLQWLPIGTPRWDGTGRRAHNGRAVVSVGAGNGYVYQGIPVQGGSTYHLRLYARTDVPEALATAWVKFFADNVPINNGPWIGYYPGKAFQSWETYVTAPLKANRARIELGASQPGMAVWIDDVSFAEITK